MLRPVEHAEFVVRTSEEIVRFAGLVANADLNAPVPSCPEWDLGKLTRHCGSVHRRVAHDLRDGFTGKVGASELPAMAAGCQDEQALAGRNQQLLHVSLL